MASVSDSLTAVRVKNAAGCRKSSDSKQQMRFPRHVRLLYLALRSGEISPAYSLNSFCLSFPHTLPSVQCHSTTNTAVKSVSTLFASLVLTRTNAAPSLCSVFVVFASCSKTQWPVEPQLPTINFLYHMWAVMSPILSYIFKKRDTVLTILATLPHLRSDWTAKEWGTLSMGMALTWMTRSSSLKIKKGHKHTKVKTIMGT